MKKIKFIILMCSALCTMAVSAVNGPSAKRSNHQILILSCDLHCQGCCDKIMKNIAFEKGVKDLQCDLKNKEVTVTFDANKTDVPTLLKAFNEIGKTATVKSYLAPRDSEPPTSPSPHADETPQTDADERESH